MSPETRLQDAWNSNRPVHGEAPASLLDAWEAEQRARASAPRARSIAGWTLLLALSLAPRFGRAEATDHYLAETLRECARPLALWIELRLEKGER